MKKVVYNTQKICIFFFRYEKLKFLAFTVDSKTGLKISCKYSTLKDQIWNLLSALRKKMWVIISILISQVEACSNFSYQSLLHFL